MKLDKHDIPIWEALQEKSDPLKFIHKFYPDSGIRSKHTAEKRKSAIRMHLEHKLDFNDNNEYKKESLSWNPDDGSQVIEKTFSLTKTEKDNLTEEIVLSKLGLDILQWKLTDCKFFFSSWSTTIKNDDNEGVAYPNYSCRCVASVKPKKYSVSSDHIKELLENLEPPKIDSIPKYSRDGEILEIAIADPHIGKLALEDESGEEYNLEIAVKLYKRAILTFLSHIEERNIKVKEFWFPFGNDYYHVDNARNTTTSGTPVDTDGKSYRIFDVGTELLMWTIKQLLQIAPVTVIYVPGNHDENLAYYSLACAEWCYKDNDNVKIDRSKLPRKWLNFGINTVLFTHLRYEKSRILDAIRNEIPKDILSKSIFIEVHGADQHHEEVKDHDGITVRRLPSITSKDKFHNDRAYGAIRKAQAFVWNEHLGLRDIIQISVFELDR